MSAVEIMQPTLEADWDTFCAVEDEIGKAEGLGLEARWRCGQMLLRYPKGGGRGGSPLRNAIRTLASELSISEAELYNRRQFAEEYPEVSTAVETFNSWTELRDSLGKRRTGMDVHYSSATPEWETPQDLFDDLDIEFSFTVDVCASAANAKCKRYFDTATDGLTQEWTGVCWMNPPYGDAIASWVQKAWDSSTKSATVVCLVPARVDTGWWWEHCRHGEIRFLKGRLRFGGGDTAAPFPSAVVVFPREPKVVWWER